MQKQPITLSLALVAGKLPRLPFVNILGVEYVAQNDVKRLPQYQIDLVNEETAQRARVLVRFEEVTYHADTTDHPTALKLLGEWLDALVGYLRETVEGKGFALPLAGSYVDSYGSNPPATSPLWRPDQNRMSTSLLDAKDTTKICARQLMGRIAQVIAHEAPALLVNTHADSDGCTRLSIDGGIGNGVTFSLHTVSNNLELQTIVKRFKADGDFYAFVHIGDTKYVITLFHRGGFHAELSQFFTLKGFETAFMKIWHSHFAAMGLIAPSVVFTAAD